MSEAMSETAAEAPATNAAVRGGVVPYLSVSDASGAAAFYVRAFAAEEVGRYPADEQGRTMHIHLYLNGSSVMLSDPFPEYGHPLKTPQAFNLHLQVDDVDAWFSRAVAAGAEVVMPVELMFWGARYGQVRDPFGVVWGLATNG